MSKPNAFTASLSIPSIFANDNAFNGRGPSKPRRVDLKQKRGSAFTAPIMTLAQADRTQSIKGRALHG